MFLFSIIRKFFATPKCPRCLRNDRSELLNTQLCDECFEDVFAPENYRCTEVEGGSCFPGCPHDESEPEDKYDDPIRWMYEA